MVEYSVLVEKLNGSDKDMDSIRDSLVEKDIKEVEKNFVELRDNFNFDNINVGRETASDTPAVLDEPTEPIQDENKPPVVSEFNGVVANRYFDMMQTDERRAKQYLKKMISDKYVSEDFNIDDYKSEENSGE